VPSRAIADSTTSSPDCPTTSTPSPNSNPDRQEHRDEHPEPNHRRRRIDAYEEASKLEPEDKEIWLNWSYIYYEQGNHEKAIETLSLGFDEIPDDAEIFYRMTVYLIEAGRFKEAFNYLENALILDFDGHTTLFDFFPKIETQKALYKIIEQFRKENS
jgi:tetratricopeptide (TPR) repeat protein